MRAILGAHPCGARSRASNFAPDKIVVNTLNVCSRRRTGATGFVAPWAENKVNPNNALQKETLGFALFTPTYGLFQWEFPDPHR